MLRSPDELEKYEFQQAYVMINCEDGSQEYVIDELRSIKCIKWIAGVIGRYDILTMIVASSVEELRETIEFKIRRIEKVLITTTIVCEQSNPFSDCFEEKRNYV